MLFLRILCIGNMLHGNDGLGPAVYGQLKHIDEPGKIEVIDGGVGGLALLPLFKDVSHVLLIDIVNSDRQPGHIGVLRNLTPSLPWQVSETAEHGGGVSTLLHFLPLYLSHLPQVDLLSVTAPSPSYYSPGLDPNILQTVDEVCEQAIAYVNTLLGSDNVSHHAQPVRASDAY